MAQLSKKIELYAAANSEDGRLMDLYGKEVASVEFEKHVKLREDESGVYIYEWNLSIPKPTTEQLNSYETAANAAEANAVIDATRRKQYLEFQHQLEMIYKDQKNGTTTFIDHCDKVRSDNPKD